MDARQVDRLIDRGKRVADVEHFETRYLDDFARTRLFDGDGLDAFVVENLLDADVLYLRGRRIVVCHKALGDRHAGLERSLLDASYGHPTEEARVFKRAYLEKRCRVRVSLRRGNLVDNKVHQDSEISVRIGNFLAADALAPARIDAREVELLFVRVEFAEKVENLVERIVRITAVAVNLVDNDNRGESERKRFLRHEARLGHRAFERIDNQKYTVNGPEDAFHLAAKIRVPRCIDDVDVVAFVADACVFRENRDAAFPLDSSGVHNAFVHFFAFVERAALFENLVDERRLAVVNMRDNRNVSDFVLIHLGYPVLGTSGTLLFGAKFRKLWRNVGICP